MSEIFGCTNPKPQASAKFQVVVRKQADVIKRRLLPFGKTVCIGRHPSNDVQIEDLSSSSIAGFHAALFWEGDRVYTLQDLGSQNGTRVNGRRTDYARIFPGTVVGIGDFELSIEVEDKHDHSTGPEVLIHIDESETDLRTSFSPISLESPNVSHLRDDPELLLLLYKLSRYTSSSLGTHEALQLILSEVATALQPDRALIAELEPRENTIQCLAEFPIQGNAIRLSRTMVDWVLTERQALLTQDALSDRRLYKYGQPAKSIEEQKIRSAICVPLEWDRKIKGLLYMDTSTRKGLFSERHLKLLSALAHDLSFYLGFNFECSALRKENLRLAMQSTPLAEFIGISPSAKLVLRKIEKGRDSDATVLLTGETGSGKEVAARALHNSSKRRSQPFVEVNCAAIPENLFESELFGIEKGVATGVEKRIGLFRQADGGTLFLDEIGELPLSFQVKLLKVLDDKKIWPVGRREPIPVDIRIVVATNRDLRSEIHDRRFREDLYERVNVFGINIPPLRERRDDIPLLCGYFLHKLRANYGKRVSRFSKNCVEALTRLEWPRNIRQLKNAIERAIILTDGPVLTEDLFDLKTDAACEPCSLDELERDHILKVLDYTKGNKEKAARVLGIVKQTLHNKGEKYKLPGFKAEM